MGAPRGSALGKMDLCAMRSGYRYDIRVVMAYHIGAGQKRDYLERRTRTVNPMNKSTLRMPKFKSESEEADWWASPAGRAYVKTQSKRIRTGGSSLVATLNRKSSVQIAIRLPEADLAQARRIADRKGIGYQTLLKMLVHEGLGREARRG